MSRRQYAGGAAATSIVGSIASTGGGTVTIGSTTGWPDGSVGPFHVVIDPGLSSEEKILVDLRSGTTLSFSPTGRGADGSVATSHASGAQIWLCYTALDADEANAHVNSTASAHAASAVTFTPVGSIAASTVQGAIAELDADTDSRMDTHEAASDARFDAIEANSWVTSIRVANPQVVQLGATTFSVTGGSSTTVPWTSETLDTEGFITVPGTTLTVPAGKGGLYVIELVWTGTTFASGTISAGGRTALSAATAGYPASFSQTLRLAAADTILCQVNNAGVTSNFTAALHLHRLSS